MVRFHLALCLIAPVLAGCYSDRLAPPNFRHSCSADGDCRSFEACVSGLCQRPCSQATVEEACPTDDGFVACFNGVCVTPCELPAEVCTGEGAEEMCERPERQGTCTNPQKCLDLGIDLSGGGGFVGGGGGEADVGVCGEWCTENSCPDGELCLDRFCVAMCDPLAPDTCNAAFGLTCQETGISSTGGLCLPDLESSDSASATGTDSDATATDAPMTESTDATMTESATDAPMTDGGT